MTMPNPQQSVLVMGEALIDLVVDPRQNEGEPQAVPGGSPANVALALGRLGYDVDLVCWIGKDDYGQLIVDHLGESTVKIAAGSDGAVRTPTALATLDNSGAATYTFDLEWAPPSPIAVPSTAQIAHTGSIGAVLEPGTETVLEAFTRAHGQALTSYDPNARPTLMGDVNVARVTVEKFVEQSDVIKVSDEDLEWLYPDTDPLDAARRWTSDLGVALIVITRGKEGPIAWTRDGETVMVTPAKVKVVDTVGAGDTFMGGLLDALARRGYKGAGTREALATMAPEELKAILEDASQVADIVVQRRGANPPWAHELGR